MAGSFYRAVTGALTLARVALTGARAPLFISWNLTFRCNLRCAYCGVEDAVGPELNTEGVIRGLESLWKLGARWVTFSGGEPLTRKDIGEIVGAARGMGYSVFISTNGALIPKKEDVILLVDHVTMSLDGPREVHDAARGKGAFDQVTRAVEICRDIGVSTSFQCTLCKCNVDAVDDTLDLAESLGVPIMFQPATLRLDSSTRPNPIAPDPESLRCALEKVARAARQGAPVLNSPEGIRHLAHWPRATDIWCGAGRLFCVVEPDGRVLACHQFQFAPEAPSKARRAEAGESQGEQFLRMDPLPGCAACWCGPIVELAMLARFRPGAWRLAVRRQLGLLRGRRRR
ncbi:MAG TPA: radical SAM protein [Candidatus Hydrogenedentes bacterium]|nr:radical SAM protein [Candidatus Hydrogenedentota bacterium]